MLLLGLFFCHGLMGQNSTRNNRILEWADYYFMNKDFDKAFSLYSKMGESLPLRSRETFPGFMLKGGNYKRQQEP